MKKNLFLIAIFLCILSFRNAEQDVLLYEPEPFQSDFNSHIASLYTPHSDNELIMQVTNYGGRIISLWITQKYSKPLLHRNAIGVEEQFFLDTPTNPIF